MVDPVLSDVLLLLTGPSFLDWVGTETGPTASAMRMLPTQTLSTAARAINTDPEVKAEVCANMAHVGLDLVGFASPAKILLRFSVLMGRVFAILSDYLPDQAMKPEELAFQLLMLGISTTLFARSVRPAMAASLDSTSFRDRRAYHVMFRKYGLTWHQFKMLMATSSEWIECPPNGTIYNHRDEDGGDCIFLLHKGDAEVKMNGKTIQRVSRNADRRGVCFLGNIEFAENLQKNHQVHNTEDALRMRDPLVGQRQSQQADFVAGPSGATLLRINNAKLLELMNDDEQIASSMRSIIFAGMQEKLSALLESVGQHQANTTESSQADMATVIA